MIAATQNEVAPKLLLLDSCGEEASLALAHGAEIVSVVRISGRSSSERLLPELRGLLDRRGWELSQLAAISVVHGPGSFTGVRVGLSTAKGLAEASGLALLVLSRLDVLAVRAAAWGGEGCVVALAAGRKEVFRADVFEGRAQDPRLQTIEALVETSAAEGKGVVCEETLASLLAGVCPRTIPALTAGDGLALALALWQSREFTDPSLADAYYLRRTEQEMLDRQAAHRERRFAAAKPSGDVSA